MGRSTGRILVPFSGQGCGAADPPCAQLGTRQTTVSSTVSGTVATRVGAPAAAIAADS